MPSASLSSASQVFVLGIPVEDGLRLHHPARKRETLNDIIGDRRDQLKGLCADLGFCHGGVVLPNALQEVFEALAPQAFYVPLLDILPLGVQSLGLLLVNVFDLVRRLPLCPPPCGTCLRSLWARVRGSICSTSRRGTLANPALGLLAQTRPSPRS